MDALSLTLIERLGRLALADIAIHEDETSEEFLIFAPAYRFLLLQGRNPPAETSFRAAWSAGPPAVSRWIEREASEYTGFGEAAKGRRGPRAVGRTYNVSSRRSDK